jgi:hypothetical protein
MSITNNSQEYITLDLGDNRVGNIVLAIRSPNSKIFQRFETDGRSEVNSVSRDGHQYTAIDYSTGIGTVRLAAGAVFYKTFIANIWREFSEIGMYGIAPQFAGVIVTRSGELKFDVTRNLQVTVTSRSQERLERRARELLNLAVGPDRSDDTPASKVLSYITDSVTIPSLQQLLHTEGWRNQYYAVKGLERIANQQAVSILIELYKAADLYERRSLHWALLKISKSNLDMKVAKMAADAVVKLDK